MAAGAAHHQPGGGADRTAGGERRHEHARARRLGGRGPGHRRAGRRPTPGRVRRGARGWTWWRSSAATAPPCRPRRRWSAPTWRSASSPAAPATCWPATCGSRPSPARAARALVSGATQAVRPGPDGAPGRRAVLRRRLRRGIRRAGHGGDPLGAQAPLGDGGLRRHHPPPHPARSAARVHVITIDGVEYDANAAMVLVANCGEVIPPFVRLRPGHQPRRRPARRRGGAGQQLRAERSGRLGPAADAPGVLGDDAYVGYARGREIRVETDPVAAGPARRRARRRHPVHRQRGPRRDPDHGAGTVSHGAVAATD